MKTWMKGRAYRVMEELLEKAVRKLLKDKSYRGNRRRSCVSYSDAAKPNTIFKKKSLSLHFCLIAMNFLLDSMKILSASNILGTLKVSCLLLLFSTT